MNTGRDDDFDRTMRALHGEAIARISPQVRRRLRTGRESAQRAAPVRRYGWPTASAIAAALALAVALPLRSPAPDETAPPRLVAGADRAGGPPPVAAPTPDETPVPASLAALEESPDFYLWLASNDAGPDGALP